MIGWLSQRRIHPCTWYLCNHWLCCLFQSLFLKIVSLIFRKIFSEISAVNLHALSSSSCSISRLDKMCVYLSVPLNQQKFFFSWRINSCLILKCLIKVHSFYLLLVHLMCMTSAKFNMCLLMMSISFFFMLLLCNYYIIIMKLDDLLCECLHTYM